MDINKEREAFEAWYRKEYDNTVIDDSEFSEILGEYESNYYWVDELNQSWMAWQAAKAQAVPEGFVSVEDKLPIDGQDVIAFDAIKHCMFKGGEFLQGYIESDTGYEYEEPVEVTHWMAVEAQEPTND